MNRVYFFFLGFIFFSCQKEEKKPIPSVQLLKYEIDGNEQYTIFNASINPTITVSFTEPINISSTTSNVALYENGLPLEITITSKNNDSTLVITPKTNLKYITKYFFQISTGLLSKDGGLLSSTLETSFTTQIDPKDKFPRLTDEELLQQIQKQTFNYFWEFGHPISGLSRERNTSGDLVTSGGSGFGIMAILVGIHREFVTRQEGLDRIQKIANFLQNKVETYHGVFPHWFSGSTGVTIPFSTKDNGGDIVETSYLIAGLLSASEYFDRNTTQEIELRARIKDIWESVEWDWHTKGTNEVLYWHWSPTYAWELNHQLKGWNEALITYILAASSPTHPISKQVYDKGWASNGGMKNGKSFYDIPLQLGPDYGGPLFFSHYSFLGIDPRNLADNYGQYWSQLVNHSKINYHYCKINPQKYNGYGPDCWGLTASDTNGGYSAHSPTNDKGVISPTAALSSFPYTPAESMAALKFFYYTLGDKTFRNYGFIDAFNLTNIWFADSFLAIDQGPIIIMIENHRSGIIWETTMKNKDIKIGLEKLGFTY